MHNTVINNIGDLVVVPTVRDIDEAERLAKHFPAVLTVGPSQHEVRFGHDNHLVLTFGDTIQPNDPYGPQPEHVEQIVNFGLANNSAILVHCHAGMSRSTSSAIAIMIAKGVDPAVAVAALSDAHPTKRAFIPNDTIVAITAKMFDVPELPGLVAKVERWSSREYDPFPLTNNSPIYSEI